MSLLAVAEGGGHAFEVALWLVLVVVAGLLVTAHRTGVPYPILLVVGGAGLGLVPGTELELEPKLVLVLFLPPLLFSAAYFSSLGEVRRNLRPIGLLSVGLVVLTTVGVGAVAHLVIGLPWAAAFALGAVLSPTDPVAAGAIASRVGAPGRFVTVVEGESLVNDSTGLIAYKFAVAAVVTGSFSLADAIGSFVLGAAAGVAVGVAVGAAVVALRRRIADAPTEIAILLLTPYFAYLPAEALGVSAVLAAVSAGIWLGWRAPRLVAPQTRLNNHAFWEVLVFVLNAALFVLVGLQLPAVLERITSEYSIGALAGYGLVVVGSVIVLRFVWVFPATYLPRRMSRRLRERDPAPHWKPVFLVAFTGMRGAVSLAAALAIPEVTANSAPFPGRDLIVFLVYLTILVTVVGQGLMLAPLIRRLGIEEHPSPSGAEARARREAAAAAVRRLDELAAALPGVGGAAEGMRTHYRRRAEERPEDGAIDGGEDSVGVRLRSEVLSAQREAVIALRDRGVIGDEVMRRIERDLDLEHARHLGP